MAAIAKQLQHSLSRNRTLASQNHVPCLTVCTPDGRPATMLCPLHSVSATEDGRLRLHFAAWDPPQPFAGAQFFPCEACVYMPKTREQYRLSGALSSSPADASQLWEHPLRDGGAAVRQFALLFPAARSRHQAGGGPLDTRSRAEDAAELLDPSARGYVTLTLDVSAVDYLSLRGPQRRCSWQRAAAAAQGGVMVWAEAQLNP